MVKVKRKTPICLGLTITLLFFLASPLIMPHSPILDLEGSQCAQNTAKKAKDKRTVENPRKMFGDEFVTCPEARFAGEATNSAWATFRKTLEEYKVFHREKLRLLKKSSDGGESEGVRTLTWACSQAKCSGLGDQLFRIQYFFLLALMSNRVFTVYWDERLERSAKYLIPNEIDWSYFNQSIGMCSDRNTVFAGRACSESTFSRSSMWGFGWTKSEFADFGKALFSSQQHMTVTGDVKAYVMFVNKDFYMSPGERITSGFEKLGLNAILNSNETSKDTVKCGHDPIWYTMLHRLGMHHVMEIPEVSSGQVEASEPWMQVSHIIFCYLFKFPQLLVNEVETVSKNLGLDSTSYTAVHLRTGFKGMPYEESYMTRYIHRNWKFFDDRDIWDKIVAHAFSLADKTLGVDSPVYLCTDTDVAKERFRAKYGERLKVVDLSLTHSANSRSRCGGGGVQQDQTEEPSDAQEEISDSTPSIYDDPYLSMWVDFVILSRSHVMVHGDSSFSVNACFVKPLSHLNQSWVLHDKKRNCIASYMGGRVTCI